MDRKKLLIACGLIGSIIVLIIGAFVIIPAVMNILIYGPVGDTIPFDNSTSKATAISIARLNEGMYGFDSFFSGSVVNASLTSDGKYWIVNMREYGDRELIVTIDAKTLMSKRNSWEETEDTWRSLDELKARYIAEIQSRDTAFIERPYKVTLEGKTVWKVPAYYNNYEGQEFVDYVYVDISTGKSKNTWDEFNTATGTDNWITLKQVDDTINKMHKERTGLFGVPFKDALRNLYPE